MSRHLEIQAFLNQEAAIAVAGGSHSPADIEWMAELAMDLKSRPKKTEKQKHKCRPLAKQSIRPIQKQVAYLKESSLAVFDFLLFALLRCLYSL